MEPPLIPSAESEAVSVADCEGVALSVPAPGLVAGADADGEAVSDPQPSVVPQAVRASASVRAPARASPVRTLMRWQPLPPPISESQNLGGYHTCPHGACPARCKGPRWNSRPSKQGYLWVGTSIASMISPVGYRSRLGA
ncbi:hypothetical protein GCM10025784_26240 [Citricoccus nitrophenolicus]